MTGRLAQVIQRLSAGWRILILTHRSPDGDAVGCAAALCTVLRRMGRSAFLFQQRDDNLKTACPSLYHPYISSYMFSEIDGFDTVVSVDVAAPALLEPGAASLRDRIDIAIDHHGANTLTAALAYVEPAAAACGEIVFQIIEAFGEDFLTPDVASALFLSLSSDTGGFRYDCTTPRTMRIAATLMEAGAAAADIHRCLFESKTRKRIDLERVIYEQLEFFYDGAVAVCCLPLVLQEKIAAGEEEYENIASIPKAIEGVQIAVILREMGSMCRISMRGSVDVSGICSVLGGGGHKAAAGAIIQGTADESKDRLLAVLGSEYGSQFRAAR